MALAFSNLTTGGGPDSTTTYTTPSVSPTAGAVVFLGVTTYQNTSVNPTTPTVSGLGLTWTLAGYADHDVAGSDRGTTFLFVGTGGASSSGSITITFPTSVNKAVYVVDQATGADTANPVVQFGSSVVSATSATAPLSTYASVDNKGYAFAGVQVSSATFTHGSGWSTLGTATPTTYALGFSETGTGSASASWSTSGRAALLAVEVAAASAAAVQGSGAATVTVTAAGSGNVVAQGSGAASVAVSASGAGEPIASGSGAASVALSASGTGYEVSGGSGSASIAVSASGTGYDIASGAGSAAVSVDASGTGYTVPQGAGDALVVVGATGTGDEPSVTPQGRGAALLSVSASGSGYAVETGQGSASVGVSASGAGDEIVQGSGSALVVVTATDTPPAPSLVDIEVSAKILSSPWTASVVAQWGAQVVPNGWAARIYTEDRLHADSEREYLRIQLESPVDLTGATAQVRIDGAAWFDATITTGNIALLPTGSATPTQLERGNRRVDVKVITSDEKPVIPAGYFYCN